eukprot:scaffold3787_cov258-Pinguiococcus_pyrenoidosus.AAC.3
MPFAPSRLKAMMPTLGNSAAAFSCTERLFSRSKIPRKICSSSSRSALPCFRRSAALHCTQLGD